jgi:hypothetical protein
MTRFRSGTNLSCDSRLELCLAATHSETECAEGHRGDAGKFWSWRSLAWFCHCHQYLDRMSGKFTTPHLGHLDHEFDPTLPIQRNAEREQSLLSAIHRSQAGLERKPVLLALDSAASPFPYKDQLRELLALHCPNFQFVDLCEIRAERFHDLLGLYEAAHSLITADTAHLHLANAVPALPVMALIRTRRIFSLEPPGDRSITFIAGIMTFRGGRWN